MENSTVEVLVKEANEKQDFISRISADNFDTTFLKFDELQEFLENLTKNDQWIDTSIGELNTQTFIGGPLLVMSEIETNKLKFDDIVTEDIIMQTADETEDNRGGTCLYTTDRESGNSYLIGKSALPSFTMRHGLAGRAILESQNMIAPKGLYIEFLNLSKKLLSIRQTETKLLIRGGKIRTANSSRYVAIPNDVLVEKLENKIESKFGESEFLHGYFSHENLAVEWELKEFQKEISQTYINSDLRPVLAFKTGDLANSAIQIQCRLIGANFVNILVGETMKLAHVGNEEDIHAKYEEHLELMYSKYNQQLEDLEKLKKVSINDALRYFDNYVEKLNFPKSSAILEEIRTDVELYYGHEATTAFELFMQLQKVIAKSREEGRSQMSIIQMEEALARLVKVKTWKLL